MKKGRGRAREPYFLDCQSKSMAVILHMRFGFLVFLTSFRNVRACDREVSNTSSIVVNNQDIYFGG